MDNNHRQIPCQNYLSAYKALISDSAAGAGQDVRLARALILGSPLVVGHSWSVVNCLGRDPKKELQGQRQQYKPHQKWGDCFPILIYFPLLHFGPGVPSCFWFQLILPPLLQLTLPAQAAALEAAI